jgi:hypothetical protein
VCAALNFFPVVVAAMPFTMNDEGELVFRTHEEVHGAPTLVASGAASAAAPNDGLTHQQRLLLALDGLEASRSRASEARTRADDAADDPSAVAAAGRREDVEGVADACAAATACSGASTATSGNSGTLDGSAASACVSSVDVTLDAQPTLGSVAGSGEAVVPMGMPVDGATPPTLGAGGALHFHIRVEAGDTAALRAEWQARGAGIELASLLAEVGACEYFAADGAMLSAVGQCEDVLPGTFGRSTTVVYERAMATAMLASRLAARATAATPPPGAKRSQLARAVSAVAKRVRFVSTDAQPATLLADSAGGDEGVAARLEREQRVAEMDALLAIVPAECHAVCVGARAREWSKYPLSRRRELLTRHLCSYSAGSLASCRRALLRLGKWLVLNDLEAECAGFTCSGATLSWFGLDEQRVSRSGGRTVIHGLRAGLDFGRRHLALAGLGTDHDAFVNIAALPPKPPTPAKAVTVALFMHLLWHAQYGGSLVAKLYSSQLVVCCIAALRVRDAQRASLRVVRGDAQGSSSGVVIAGMCYTSKHPKRRAHMPMPFFAVAWPSHSHWYGSAVTACCDGAGESTGRDYMFPALQVPRSRSFDDARVVVLDTPARSATVIAVLRWILTLPPLALSKTEAAAFSGHSMRHFLPTLARFMALPEEDRLELARWAATCDTRGRRHSMPNRYAAEAEAPRILQIQRDLFQRLDLAIGADGASTALDASEPILPMREGWPALQRALVSGSGEADPARFVSPDADVGAEDSSSGSDDD